MEDKVKKQVDEELSGLLSNYWKEIKEVVKRGENISLSLKVVLEPLGQMVKISPTLEFYPEPKIKSEKYSVEVDTKQLSLFDGQQEATG